MYYSQTANSQTTIHNIKTRNVFCVYAFLMSNNQTTKKNVGEIVLMFAPILAVFLTSWIYPMPPNEKNTSRPTSPSMGVRCGVGVHHARLRVFGRVGVSYYRSALSTLVPRAHCGVPLCLAGQRERHPNYDAKGYEHHPADL